MSATLTKKCTDAPTGGREVDLYDQCFPADSVVRRSAPQPVDPRVAFARVLKQIETMELKTRAALNLETTVNRGYVFAIHEVGSDFVSIGYGGRTHLASTVKRLQVGNPHKLEVVAVLQRYSLDDARALCDMISSGLIMYQTRNKVWYTMDDSRRRIANMFARIDKIEPPKVIEPPPLTRQQGFVSAALD